MKIFALETRKMQWLPLVLLLLVSITFSCINAVHANELVCPPPEDILPCFCESPTSPPPWVGTDKITTFFIKCYNLKTHQALSDIFENNQNLEFTTLKIYNSRMSFIPTSIFDNARFKDLDIFNSTFTVLFDKPPTSDYLEGIQIRHTVFQRGFDWRWFSNLSIRYIRLDGIAVRKIGRSFWKALPKTLEVLFLNHSNTTKIRPQTFENFETRLRWIDIKNGRLKKLEPNSFPNTVEQLALDYHRIETLPDGIFESMVRLVLVSLEGNLFTTIREEIFGRISVVDLRNNPIKCDCRIHWTLKRRFFIRDTRCVGPEHVRGKWMNKLKEDDFNYCKSFANNKIV